MDGHEALNEIAKSPRPVQPPSKLESLAPYDSSTELDGRTATGRLLQSGGTIVDNAEDQGAPPAPDYSPSSPHFTEPEETPHPTGPPTGRRVRSDRSTNSGEVVGSTNQ